MIDEAGMDAASYLMALVPGLLDNWIELPSQRERAVPNAGEYRLAAAILMDACADYLTTQKSYNRTMIENWMLGGGRAVYPFAWIEDALAVDGEALVLRLRWLLKGGLELRLGKNSVRLIEGKRGATGRMLLRALGESNAVRESQSAQVRV